MTNTLFPMIIVAGGLATRLYPVTKTIPKSLISIHGKPFIDYQLTLLRNKGITKVILSLGYLCDSIMQQVGDGKKYNVDVRYSLDGEQLLGTGGAVKNALSVVESENFFVMYGDSYLDCDFAAVQKKYVTSKKLSLMTIYHNRDQGDKSNIVYQNNEISVYDKLNKTDDMHYIDYGLGIFNQKAFDLKKKEKKFDLAQLYQALLSRNELASYEVENRFYEIGSAEGIEAFSRYIPMHLKCE
ncbi:MAG: nucleotidyl transferase [Gammaproteobacteria bacterium RIFCSPHIGHO2_12_FULL_39_24]|nr:MAG: nucleotidyl transferase [Gammaproteobacteria bacterium RIFCSPHIGHO2_12_FULL_39_24]